MPSLDAAFGNQELLLSPRPLPVMATKERPEPIRITAKTKC
jgi:hypothetical protein